MLSNIRKYVKPKPISRQNQKLTQQHNWKKTFLQPMRSVSICPSVRDSVCPYGLREGYRVKECYTERSVIFLSVCVEGILQLFTNFYLQFSIFLRNDCDCKVVDPYKARKRYTVTESLDLIVSVK